MTDEQAGRPDRNPEQKLVRCRRTDQAFSVEGHAKCPYCFGRLEKIESGDHSGFCDFEPGKDPINFGFREDGSRYDRA